MPFFEFNRKPSSPPQPVPEGRWNRTFQAQNRVEHQGEYRPPEAGAPYGYYANRFIIGSRFPHVIGGVYLGAGSREALVVDDYLCDKEGRMHESLLYHTYTVFIEQRKRYCERHKIAFRDGLLRAAYEKVPSLMTYDDAAVNEMVQQFKAIRPDQKVALDHFVLKGVGVCRHQALLLAYFLEKLSNERDPAMRITGTFSLERNSVRTPTHQLGAHVWVRYTTGTSGHVAILDPAQHVFAKLDEVLNDPTKWVYARPDELDARKTRA